MSPDSSNAGSHLTHQVRFLIEIDKLKRVLRQSYLFDEARRENSAEHSWHLAMAAVTLAEHAEPGVDIGRVIQMALVHDLVEIDAGDTYCYDMQGALDKEEREQRAARRLFALLPGEQGRELRAVWAEFEARQTKEARFAAALDRFIPLLHNYHTKGRSWREHDIRKEQVIERNCHIADGSPALWRFAEALIEDAVRKGYLSE